MPYFFDLIEAPDQGDDGWEEIEEIWELIKNELLHVYFETEEEALRKNFKSTVGRDTGCFTTDKVARFRKTDDQDQLRYYHDLGLEALAHTENCIRNKQMDGRFAYYWALLNSCYGVVAAAMLAHADDLASERAGVAGREKTNLDQQRKWFAHYFMRPELVGLSREQKTDRIQHLIDDIINGCRPEYVDLNVLWFEKFLNLRDTRETNEHYGQITWAFRQRKLTEKKIRELVKEPADGLPPLDLTFPPPR